MYPPYTQTPHVLYQIMSVRFTLGSTIYLIGREVCK